MRTLKAHIYGFHGKTRQLVITLLLAIILISPVSAQHHVEPVTQPQISSEHQPENMQPAHEEGKLNIDELLGHHLNDAVVYHLPPIHGVDISITKRVIMIWIVSLLLVLILVPVARSIAGKRSHKPSRLSGLIEVFVNFVRKDISESSMGAHHAHNYDPFLLTVFFFILFCNLIGLFPPIGELMQVGKEIFGMAEHAPAEAGHHAVPFLVALWPGMTATGDISVTLVLAGITLLLIFLAGFANQGPMFLLHIVPKGVPLALWPLLWPIEFFGILIKSGVLAIRLLANMTAGHVIILVLLSFIFQFQSAGLIPVSILGSSAIYFLELLVAFLQAYIFTFLTALFIASAQHRH